jgi:hypothetical protein
MECLVCQNSPEISGDKKGIGDTGGIQIDLAGEISSFVQANPIPSIGIGIALVIAIYSILK